MRAPIHPPHLARPPPAGDQSRNNWWVGLLAFGEGWHNNHHAFEFSARHGLKDGQADMTWLVSDATGRARRPGSCLPSGLVGGGMCRALLLGARRPGAPGAWMRVQRAWQPLPLPPSSAPP